MSLILFPLICGICGKVDKDWICTKSKMRLERYEKFELINNKKINEIIKSYDIMFSVPMSKNKIRNTKTPSTLVANERAKNIKNIKRSGSKKNTCFSNSKRLGGMKWKI